ncbi:MAG TPA: DUF2231 domain-containing protein [Chthonomonadaceae bacterium]|nr:DUF2231 domain-containing protein [Chthonomonadaceae bacterium]
MIAFRNVRTALIMMGIATIAGGAQAKPEYLDVLTKTYPASEKALSARSCVNCHVSDSDYSKNAYGKQVAQQLLNSGTRTLTPEILHAVESQASNPGDISNLEKIKQGVAPADRKSAGPGAAAGTSAPAGGATAAPGSKPLWPKNAFHPAIVHFPIALFLAALLLDLVGLVRGSPKLLLAGWYNLVMAAVSSVGAIGTGFFAAITMRLPLKGLIFTHLTLAAIAALIMCILVALRVHRHEKMSRPLRIAYFVLAFAGMLLISYSAHLGGAFVYGE